MSALYTGAGELLIHHTLDASNASIQTHDALDLGSPIQYAWAHPSGRWLYVATGHRGKADHAVHALWTCRIAPRTGALSAHGEPLALTSRPIHLCTDPRGEHVYVAYNEPSAITVHPVQADGRPGPVLPQPHPLDMGIFAHHIHVAPDGRHVLLVTRGNDAKPGRSEDPGAIKLLSQQAGELRSLASVAPNGGYGFGPRDIDFHPNGRWLYASIERQNRLQVFGYGPQGITPQPVFDVSNLNDPDPPRPRQLVGTLKVHPKGHALYVVNRADGVHPWDGCEVFAGGENNIAVYQLDAETGRPRPIQHADTQSIYVRTIAMDPSGRLLVAASVSGLPVRDGDEVRELGTALTVFRIHGDGTLHLAKRHTVDVGGRKQQWVGIVAL